MAITLAPALTLTLTLSLTVILTQDYCQWLTLAPALTDLSSSSPRSPPLIWMERYGITPYF
jgi:hypothetical protein